MGRPRVTCASRTSESAFAFGATFTKSPTSPLPKSTRRRSAAARPRTGSAVSANGGNVAETSSPSPSPSSEPAKVSEPLARRERRGVASAFSQSASAATGADVGRANLFLSRAATRRARTIRVAAAASFAATSPSPSPSFRPSPFASSFASFRRSDASDVSVSGNDRRARNDSARPADGNGGRSAASGDGVRGRRRALCPSLSVFLFPRSRTGEDMFRECVGRPPSSSRSRSHSPPPPKTPSTRGSSKSSKSSARSSPSLKKTATSSSRTARRAPLGSTTYERHRPCAVPSASSMNPPCTAGARRNSNTGTGGSFRGGGLYVPSPRGTTFQRSPKRRSDARDEDASLFPSSSSKPSASSASSRFFAHATRDTRRPHPPQSRPNAHRETAAAATPASARRAAALGSAASSSSPSAAAVAFAGGGDGGDGAARRLCFTHRPLERSNPAAHSPHAAPVYPPSGKHAHCPVAGRHSPCPPHGASDPRGAGHATGAGQSSGQHVAAARASAGPSTPVPRSPYASATTRTLSCHPVIPLTTADWSYASMRAATASTSATTPPGTTVRSTGP